MQNYLGIQEETQGDIPLIMNCFKSKLLLYYMLSITDRRLLAARTRVGGVVNFFGRRPSVAKISWLYITRIVQRDIFNVRNLFVPVKWQEFISGDL